MAETVGSSNWHLPQARAGFEVSWLVHVLGVQAVASPHSSRLADASWTQRLRTASLAGFLLLRWAKSGLHLWDRASLLHGGRDV